MTRTAADIGRGLLPARPARAIRPAERIHVLGVAGAGASAAALLAHRAGALVSGCDPGGPSPYTAALEVAGIELDWRHSPEHIGRTDGGPDALPERLAVTKALTAVDPDNPELVAARKAGIAAEGWQQLVADAAASAGQRLVAVAGTHGKSTTTGWLVHLLTGAGRDPSAFVGALLPTGIAGDPPSTARWGSGDLFVVEADEYAGNFEPYRPQLAILLNVEWEHPDVFADQAAVVDAFARWLAAAAESADRPALVANVGDGGVRDVIARLPGWQGGLLTVALAETGQSADLVGSHEPNEEGGGRLAVRSSEEEVDYELRLDGRHNAENALTVIGAARLLGVAEQHVRRGLVDFRGVGRRLELKGEARGVVVLDDYGHHPTAIGRTLEAVRRRYPGRRLWAVYEPLTYHRTARMLDAFAQVLSRADEVAIADIWAGRDPDTTVTSSDELAAAVARQGRDSARATGSVEQTAEYLAQAVAPGDVVLVMGGGRSYVIAQRLVELLRESAAP